MIHLQGINRKNIWEITQLTVFEHQHKFVATNTQSLLEAYTSLIEKIPALPFGIYQDTTPIGFVMFGYGQTDPDDPEIAKDNYLIWRFMLDQNFQGQGLGKQALAVALAYLKTTQPSGPATACWLSYEGDNHVARQLYQQAGFQETGELSGDEVVAVLSF